MLLAALIACVPITVDLDRVIAIEIVGTGTRTVEEGATLQLEANALDAAGDPVPDAVIVWELIDVDSGQVGFTLDSVTGQVSGVQPGMGRVQARVESLRSGSIVITVSPAPDSIAGVGLTRVTLDSGAVTTAPLTAAIFDLTSDPGVATPLSGIPVEFAVTLPTPGSSEAAGFFLSVGDTVPGAEPHRRVATTGSSGEAAVTVHRAAEGTLPDSAVITAGAMTAAGGTVAGTPVAFIVLFAAGGT